MIINDTSTVYEIKTEFDSMSRLKFQLHDYSRVFDKIYLVTTEKNYMSATSMLDGSVGLYLMRHDGYVEKVKEAESNAHNTDPEAIFSCLRKKEYLSAIKDVYGYIPDFPMGLIWRECIKLFMKLTSEKAHELMVKHTVKRSLNKPFSQHIKRIPIPISYICLASNRPRWIVPEVIEALDEPVTI